VCPACPIGWFCPSPIQRAQCPDNSNTTAGAYTILNCTCNPGYVCNYYKTISVTFSLSNISLADFTNDVNGVQTRFLASVAAAAGVTVDNVSIVSVSMTTTTGRRLLQLEQNREPAISVIVRIADVPASGSLLHTHPAYDSAMITEHFVSTTPTPAQP
jgi:hypothetical protein